MPSVTKTSRSAGLEWKLLHPERAARLQTERQVDVEVDLLDAAVAQPEREWVPGIDDGRRTAVQVDTQQLAGDEVARLGVRGQVVVGFRMPVEGGSGRGGGRCGGCATRRVARSAACDLVPDSVGDRQLQGITVEVVVKGVASDGAGGSGQPASRGCRLRVLFARIGVPHCP